LNENRGGLNKNHGGAKFEENGVLEGTAERDGVIEDDFVEDGATEETVVETANGDVVEGTANGDVAETANMLDTATLCPAPSVFFAGYRRGGDNDSPPCPLCVALAGYG
jgi:hypothetical protein